MATAGCIAHAWNLSLLPSERRTPSSPRVLPRRIARRCSQSLRAVGRPSAASPAAGPVSQRDSTAAGCTRDGRYERNGAAWRLPAIRMSHAPSHGPTGFPEGAGGSGPAPSSRKRAPHPWHRAAGRPPAPAGHLAIGSGPGKSTRRAIGASSSTTVQPHARGDDASVTSRYFASFGPPPRAWGRLNGFQQFRYMFRSTPTRVGTTSRTRPDAPGVAVHPHARGDDEAGAANALRSIGPPPRAWGRLNGGAFES